MLIQKDGQTRDVSPERIGEYTQKGYVVLKAVKGKAAKSAKE